MRPMFIYGAPVVFLVGICALGFSLFGFPSHVFSSTSSPITGYAWSDTIGWISLDCSNESPPCAIRYGLTTDIATGNVSGYAWSDNIGWVSAQPADVAGCPAGSCTPHIDPSSGVMTGWLKALAGGTVGSGGWDGWISLNCSNDGTCGTSSYYPQLNTLTRNFFGFAWGSDVVGWVDFRYAHSTFPTCTPTPPVCVGGPPPDSQFDGCTTIACPSSSCDVATGMCVPLPSPSGTIIVSPKIVHAGGHVTVSWNITNVTSCTVTGSNGDGVSPLWSGASGNKTSGPIDAQTIYLLHCTDLSGFPYEQQATVNIAPTFQEK